MQITWLGHSCFLIEDSKGRKLLTDPFDGSVGYKVFENSADIVTISHHHFDHDYVEKIKGSPKIIDKVGLFNVCDIDISGIASYHDKMKGEKRGENIIFTFKMDGYKLCHLGDLGYILTDEDLQKIGTIDILFIPVGGNYTIDGKEAAVVAKLLNSHIVIPMHFKTSATKLPLEGAEHFITNMKNGDRIRTKSLTISEPLNQYNLVKILEFI